MHLPVWVSFGLFPGTKLCSPTVSPVPKTSVSLLVLSVSVATICFPTCYLDLVEYLEPQR